MALAMQVWVPRGAADFRCRTSGDEVIYFICAAEAAAPGIASNPPFTGAARP